MRLWAHALCLAAFVLATSIAGYDEMEHLTQLSDKLAETQFLADVALKKSDFCEEPKGGSGKSRTCEEYSLCGGCTRSRRCGWCGKTQRCVEGDVGGPANKEDECAIGPDREWDYEFCSREPCSVYSSCKTCVADPACGWCPSLQTCGDGSKDGPAHGKCPDWQAEECPLICTVSNKPSRSSINPPDFNVPGTAPQHNRVAPANVKQAKLVEDAGPTPGSMDGRSMVQGDQPEESHKSAIVDAGGCKGLKCSSKDMAGAVGRPDQFDSMGEEVANDLTPASALSNRIGEERIG